MKSFLLHAFCWAFGVITCAYFTAVTLFGCSQSPYLVALFSPLVLISVSNAIALIAILNSVNLSKSALGFLGTINGVALIVSGILLCALSPLCLLAGLIGAFSVMYPPISLICLFYLCVAIGPFLTSAFVRRRLGKIAAVAQVKSPWLPISSCIAIVFACILIAVFPVTLTQACEAAVAQKTMLPQGLLLLRGTGDQNVMLQACYGEKARLPWFFSMAQSFLRSDGAEEQPSLSESDAREIFYRTTGKPFNTFPRTKRILPGSSSMIVDDFFMDESRWDWDEDYYNYLYYGDRDFAGETVGGVVRGLALKGSQISGWVDPAEAVAHLSWKMKFQIDKGIGKEIRAQILLPPHAVATGCALWINGVKHDCRIAARESSRQAYTASAVQGQKPLLVSTAGAGRILLQSSTGYWGKNAELVVDMTAPLQLLKDNKAALPLPMLTERNFSIDTKHSINLAGPPPVQAGSSYTSNKGTITGVVENEKLSAGGGTMVFEAPAAGETLTAQSDANNKAVAQKITSERLSSLVPTIIVVDGSAPMAPEMNAICDALQSAQLRRATIVWASDQPLTVIADASTQSADWKKAIDKLRDSSCLGGQNNAEALTSAITKFAQTSDANIVWLHAGQPVKFTGNNLLSIIRNATHKIKLYEYQVVPGPNEVIKSLDQSGSLTQVPQIGSTTSDIQSLLNRLAGTEPTYQITRTFLDGTPPATSAAKHPKEIAQLCVADLVLANVDNKEERKKYGTMAEQNHLITPLTSGIVLDDESSYKKFGVTTHAQSSKKDVAGLAGLKNFSASSFIPVKPEPPMSLLMACALLVMSAGLWIVRKRQHA